MGIPPSEIEAMTLWQYTAAVHEWKRRHDEKSTTKAPTEAEFDDMIATFEDWHLPDVVLH